MDFQRINPETDKFDEEESGKMFFFTERTRENAGDLLCQRDSVRRN